MPCVIENHSFAKSILHFDTDLLEKHMGEQKFKVYSAETNRFMYYDYTKNLGKYYFKPPVTSHSLTFAEYAKLAREKDEINKKEGFPLDRLLGKKVYETHKPQDISLGNNQHSTIIIS